MSDTNKVSSKYSTIHDLLKKTNVEIKKKFVFPFRAINLSFLCSPKFSTFSVKFGCSVVHIKMYQHTQNHYLLKFPIQIFFFP